jgi:hypothetical protein
VALFSNKHTTPPPHFLLRGGALAGA